MIEYKNILTGVFEKVSGLKEERLSAGTRYRLMGLVADITEVVQTLQQEVLERVSREAVLDADVDIDYTEMSELTKSVELPERADADDAVGEQIRLVNEGLAELSNVLAQIAQQLVRRHKDDEYARLYDQEKRRYLSSGTAGRARSMFDEWLYDVCDGTPSLENFNDYVTEKLVHMFEKGVFRAKVEHIQRASRYPLEFDFSQLDDDHPLKKTAYKHYSELRKMVEYKDGYLVVNPVKVGRHFYSCRHDGNAKGLRIAFLKYMHKIDMAQQERRKLMEAQAEADRAAHEDKEVLNYFAPTKHLKVLLKAEWFGMLTTDDKKYDAAWCDRFVDGLMASEHRDHIAGEWAVTDKRLKLKCMVIGGLKDAGVLRGSYNSIAKLLDIDDENAETLAKYMGLGKKQPYADWISDYIKS